MTQKDKLWLCKLAMMVINMVVHALGDGLQISNWRTHYQDTYDDFITHGKTE